MAITNCPGCGALREWDPFGEAPCPQCIERKHEARWGRALSTPARQQRFSGGFARVARKLLTFYGLYFLICLTFEVQMRKRFDGHKDALRQLTESTPYLAYLGIVLIGAVAVFIGGLLMMRRVLEPRSSNHVLAHFIHVPLLLIPALAALVILVPPWAIPFVIDGRSWGDFLKWLNQPL